MHPLLLIAAAIGGGIYLWNRSKSQLTSALPGPSPSPVVMPGGGGSVYQPTAYQQDAANFPAGQYVVSTQTDPLNLRSGPSTSSSIIGELPKGSTVSTDGVVTAGFTGITDNAGNHLGWAATEYLTPVSDGVIQTSQAAITPSNAPLADMTSGYVGAGYAVPLNVALQTQRCLNKMGCRPALPLTGYWDAHTQQCLADFQSQHGLPVTGQCDPYTRQLLQQICS